jgi:C-terminal processing protease CtpA/Prc
MKKMIFVVAVLTSLLALAMSLFGQVPARPSLDRGLKRQTVDSISLLLDSAYVFPQTAQKMIKLIKGNLKSGRYDKMDDAETFALKLTEDLRSVSKDLHLSVRYDPAQIAAIRQDTAKKDQIFLEMLRKNNFGFLKAEYLPGNVGYLELRSFADPKQPEAGLAAVSAMNYLANSRAIIFDLRKNGGGHPEMIQLLSSYLFAQPTHLNDIYERPGNITQQYWSLPYIPGSRRPEVPVYILTSNYTFSGAEEFSNNLKELKRATLVGEATGGGAHPVDFKVLNDYFTMSLPFGRAINPISKSNWEGTGVIPQVKVPADSAFNVAYLMALDTLINAVSNDRDRAELKNIRQLKQAEFSNFKVAEELQKKYAGSYGTRTLIYEQGQLYLLRPNRPKVRLLAVSEASFVLDIIGGQINMVINSEGKPVAIDYIKPGAEPVRSEKSR